MYGPLGISGLIHRRKKRNLGIILGVFGLWLQITTVMFVPEMCETTSEDAHTYELMHVNISGTEVRHYMHMFHNFNSLNAAQVAKRYRMRSSLSLQARRGT